MAKLSNTQCTKSALAFTLFWRWSAIPSSNKYWQKPEEMTGHSALLFTVGLARTMSSLTCRCIMHTNRECAVSYFFVVQPDSFCLLHSLPYTPLSVFCQRLSRTAIVSVSAKGKTTTCIVWFLQASHCTDASCVQYLLPSCPSASPVTWMYFSCSFTTFCFDKKWWHVRFLHS